MTIRLSLIVNYIGRRENLSSKASEAISAASGAERASIKFPLKSSPQKQAKQTVKENA
jgi:hypothetical protein